MSADPLRGALLQLQHTVELIAAQTVDASDVPVETIVADALHVVQQHVDQSNLPLLESKVILELLLTAAQLSVGYERDRVSESVIQLWKLFSQIIQHDREALDSQSVQAFLDCLIQYTTNSLLALRDAMNALHSVNNSPHEDTSTVVQQLEASIRVAGFFTQRITLILSSSNVETASVRGAEDAVFSLLLRFHGILAFCNLAPRGDFESCEDGSDSDSSKQSVFDSSVLKSFENVRKILFSAKSMIPLLSCSRSAANASGAHAGASIDLEALGEEVFGALQVSITLLTAEGDKIDTASMLQLVLVIINCTALCLTWHPHGSMSLNKDFGFDIMLSSLTASVPAMVALLTQGTGTNAATLLLGLLVRCSIFGSSSSVSSYQAIECWVARTIITGIVQNCKSQLQMNASRISEDEGTLLVASIWTLSLEIITLHGMRSEGYDENVADNFAELIRSLFLLLHAEREDVYMKEQMKLLWSQTLFLIQSPVHHEQRFYKSGGGTCVVVAALKHNDYLIESLINRLPWSILLLEQSFNVKELVEQCMNHLLNDQQHLPSFVVNASMGCMRKSSYCFSLLTACMNTATAGIRNETSLPAIIEKVTSNVPLGTHVLNWILTIVEHLKTLKELAMQSTTKNSSVIIRIAALASVLIRIFRFFHHHQLPRGVQKILSTAISSCMSICIELCSLQCGQIILLDAFLSSIMIAINLLGTSTTSIETFEMIRDVSRQAFLLLSRLSRQLTTESSSKQLQLNNEMKSPLWKLLSQFLSCLQQFVSSIPADLRARAGELLPTAEGENKNIAEECALLVQARVCNRTYCLSAQCVCNSEEINLKEFHVKDDINLVNDCSSRGSITLRDLFEINMMQNLSAATANVSNNVMKSKHLFDEGTEAILLGQVSSEGAQDADRSVEREGKRRRKDDITTHTVTGLVSMCSHEKVASLLKEQDYMSVLKFTSCKAAVDSDCYDEEKGADSADNEGGGGKQVALAVLDSLDLPCTGSLSMTDLSAQVSAVEGNSATPSSKFSIAIQSISQ